ncbi:MAG: hypothetical protein WCI43_01375 [Candidatus Firestonebacteria bacterium]
MKETAKNGIPGKDGIKAGINRIKRYWRRLILLEGLEIVFLTVVFAAAAGFLLDMVLKLTYTGRYLVLFSSLLMLLVNGALFLVLPLFKRIDDDEVALKIEELNPELKSSLISSVQLKRSKLSEQLGGSAKMIEALRADTFSRFKTVKYKKIFKKLRLVVLAFFLAGASLGVAKYTASYPAAVKTFISRVLRPGADIAPFSFTKLELEPKDCFVLKGGKVDVRIKLNGVLQEKAVLHYKLRSGAEWETVSLSKLEPGLFTYSLNEITVSVSYYAASGDGKSNAYEITVKERPVVIKTKFTYTYPAYTKLTSKTDEVSGGDIAAVYGTKVKAEFTTNTAVKKAELIFKNKNRENIAVRNDTVLVAGLEVREDTSYIINMMSREGFGNIDPPEYSIRALPDNPPLLYVLEPEKEISVTKTAVLGLQVKAVDDFGINKIELRYTVLKRGKEEAVPITFKEKGAKQVTAFYSWNLRALKVDQGQRIEYTVSTVDNNSFKPAQTRSEIFAINIIGKAEMLANIREKENKSREEIGKLITLEKEEKNKADKLKNKPGFDDNDKNEMSRDAQSQKNLAEQARKISADLKELVEQRKSNEVAGLAELRLREEIQNKLEGLAANEMPEAANKIQEAAFQEDRKKTAGYLSEASAKQAEILSKLQELEKSLGMIDSLEQLIFEAQRLVSEQIKENAKMKKVKKPAEADFVQLSAGEAVIADGVRSLRSLSERTGNLLKETSPEVYNSLSSISLQYPPIQDTLGNILGNMKAANTVYLILSDQETLIGLMRKLASDLETLRRQKGGLAEQDKLTDPEQKKLEELANELYSAKQMADQQADLNNQTRQLDRKPDKTQLDAKGLAQQQAELSNKAAELGAEMAKDSDTKKMAGELQDIANKMEQAGGKINAKETGSAVQKMQQEISGKLGKLQNGLQDALGKQQGKAGMQAGQGEGHKAEEISTGKQNKVNKEAANWGDLPPEVQKEMLDSMGENVPPEYAEFLKAYYKKLSEKGNK